MAFRGQSSKWEDMTFINKKKDVDPRFFVPSKDSEGKVAVIGRFLPAPDGSPICEKRTHYYEGPGGKINTNCRYALGENCPICGASIAAHKSGDKKRSSDLRAQSKYYVNFLVVKDPICPDNNGKVFILEIGQKLCTKIRLKLKPDNGLDDPCNVFDYFEGANFKLIGVPSFFVDKNDKKIVFTDYDQSSFDSPKALTQKEAERVDDLIYDLGQWRNPDQFKSFDELKKMLEDADGISVNGNAAPASSGNVTKTTVANTVSSSVADLASVDTADSTASGGDDWMKALQDSIKG